MTITPEVAPCLHFQLRSPMVGIYHTYVLVECKKKREQPFLLCLSSFLPHNFSDRPPMGSSREWKRNRVGSHPSTPSSSQGGTPIIAASVHPLHTLPLLRVEHLHRFHKWTMGRLTLARGLSPLQSVLYVGTSIPAYIITSSKIQQLRTHSLVILLDCAGQLLLNKRASE